MLIVKTRPRFSYPSAWRTFFQVVCWAALLLTAVWLAALALVSLSLALGTTLPDSVFVPTYGVAVWTLWLVVPASAGLALIGLPALADRQVGRVRFAPLVVVGLIGLVAVLLSSLS